MRGGSSFFGDIFKNNSEVAFWYEPVAPFYMANYGASKFMFPQDIFWQGERGDRPKLRQVQREKVKLDTKEMQSNRTLLHLSFEAGNS